MTLVCHLGRALASSLRCCSTSVAAALVCLSAVLGSPLAAQATTAIRTQAGLPAVATPVVPTFQSLSAASGNQDLTLVQLRRFRGDAGAVTVVREQIQVRGKGPTPPGFSVTFLAVEGELPGSPLTQKWQSTYNRLGPLFFQYASFRVRDSVRAQANYTLHDFGPVTRIGRSARRMVVFPLAADKSIWVIDVDDVAQVPLYAGEFDSQMRILSEVEAVSIAMTITGSVGASSSVGVSCNDFQSALAQLAAPAGVIDPDLTVVSEYAIDSIVVRTDGLNGRQKLVMGFTDGIDQFLVTQAPGSPDPFAGMPSQNAQGGGHTIARYRDPAMSVLMFWDEGVSFHVSGSGGLRRLDELARRIYVQAVR